MPPSLDMTWARTRMGRTAGRLGALFLVGLSCLSPLPLQAQPAATSAPVVPVAQPAAPAPAAAAPAAKPAAKPAAAAATKPATAARPAAAAAPKTPAAPKPAPTPKLAVAPKGPALSKADLFQRAAPATVFLVAQEGNRFQAALGTIVKPNGVVVSDSRLLSGVERGTVHAFLSDSITPGDEDPVLFMRANQDKAKPVQIVRIDSTSHLVLLQLPQPEPKKPYRALDLYDVRGLSAVGADVMGVRMRGRQTLGFQVGTIAAARPDLIELEPSLPIDNAGGPILSMNGRLLGVGIYLDKATSAPGVVRPVETIQNLLIGKQGEEPKASDTKEAPEMSGSESRNAVEAVRIALGTALGQKLEKKAALQLHSEFIAAMAMRGRGVVSGVDSGEQLSALVGALTKDSPFKAKVVEELFPSLVVDKKGVVFVKKGTKYEQQKQSANGVATIDDVTGTLYVGDNHRQLMYFDSASKIWRNSGMAPVAQARASGGTLFTLMEDGRLLSAQADGKESMQIFPRSLRGASIHVSSGTLYVLENNSVYRYRKNDKGKFEWENKLKPIAFAMQQLVARADNFYGMDLSGRVFSSAAQRYIDREGNIAMMWPVGKDLLVMTKDNLRFFYSLASDSWSPWTQW
ncbi:MAG: hypothetical protein U1A78_22120 [Polyangia bacterium]